MFGFILPILLLLQTNALYENPAADRVIRQSLQAQYNLRLPDARQAAEALKREYPDHPAGYTLAAETYWWEAQTDVGNDRIEDAYYEAQKLAVQKAEAAIEAGKYSKVETTAYLASAHGSLARFQVTQKGAMFSAMRAGLRAHKYAEEVYKFDKDYYDIYVGLGAFNYFSGSLPAVIKPFAWLIGARGDRNLGLQQLKTAMEKARYSQTEAQIVYYTAMLESEKNYAEAWRTLQGLRSSYPDNFVFYVWTADWFRRQGKGSEGAEHFEKIFQQESARSPLLARYALIEKADIQIVHGNKAAAQETLRRVKAMPGRDPVQMKRIEKLENKLGQ